MALGPASGNLHARAKHAYGTSDSTAALYHTAAT